MTEKEKRVSMLNKDLQAGRIKLPDHDFKREYLGEWKDDRAEAMAYAMTAPRGAAHLCALCREPIALDPGVYTAAQIDQRIADHHAVCPKRPLAVGDYVRWERIHRDSWIEGEVVRASSDGSNLHINVAAFGGSLLGVTVGEVQRVDGPRWKESTAIRRIPRPARAQATVPMVSTCDVCCIPGATAEAGRCTHGYLYRSAVREPTSPAPTLAVRTAHGDIQITADPTLKPGEIAFDQRQVYRPVVVDREAMERAMRDEKLMQRLQDESGKRIAWLAIGGTKVHTLEATPAPALVDGMDREWCLARWMENRLAVDGGAAPPNVMTRMQRDVGRAMWLARFGAQRSAALRDKVAAGREADRNRVRVELEVDPWE